LLNKEIIVENETGIHLKPASAIAQAALKYKDTKVILSKNGEEADAKSVTSILSLGAIANTRLILGIDGKDEAACQKEILEVISRENI